MGTPKQTYIGLGKQSCPVLFLWHSKVPGGLEPSRKPGSSWGCVDIGSASEVTLPVVLVFVCGAEVHGHTRHSKASSQRGPAKDVSTLLYQGRLKAHLPPSWSYCLPVSPFLFLSFTPRGETINRQCQIWACSMLCVLSAPLWPRFPLYSLKVVRLGKAPWAKGEVP